MPLQTTGCYSQPGREGVLEEGGDRRGGGAAGLSSWSLMRSSSPPSATFLQPALGRSLSLLCAPERSQKRGNERAGPLHARRCRERDLETQRSHQIPKAERDFKLRQNPKGGQRDPGESVHAGYQHRLRIILSYYWVQIPERAVQ